MVTPLPQSLALPDYIVAQVLAALAAGPVLPVAASELGFVRSVGAAYDGVTDDTSAHQTAITLSAALGLLWHPGAGTTLTGPLIFPAGFRGCVFQPNNLVVIKMKRQAYATGAALMGGTALNEAWIGGFTLDCNDPCFYGPAGTVGAVGVSAIAIESGVNVKVGAAVYGQFCYGLLFNNCSGGGSTPELLVTATGNSFRGIEVESATVNGGQRMVLDQPTVVGECNNHLISVYHCEGVRVLAPSIVGPNTVAGGFGVSLENSADCRSIGADVTNTWLEGVQITGCSDSYHDDAACRWDVSHGTDYGSSIDASIDCEIRFSDFYNSYKSAVGLAADDGSSTRIRAVGIRGHNCGLRASTVGDAAGCYMQAAAANGFSVTDFEFEDCRFSCDTTAPTHGYTEYGAVIGGKVTRCDYSSAPSEVLVANSSTRFWDIALANYTPVITGTNGAAIGYTVTYAWYQRRGDVVYKQSLISINNAAGAPGVRATLPVPFPTTGGGGILTGRNDATGAFLVATVGGNTGEIDYNYTGSAPANGDILQIGGEYVVHPPGT